jgi:hypothetical protein
MAIKLNNYNNIFTIIYRSFFCNKLYNFIFKQDKPNIFFPIFAILVISFLVPCLIIQHRLANFTYDNNPNILVQELKEAILATPDIALKKGELLYKHNDNNLPYVINIPSLDKSLITFAPSANSLIAHNTTILFSNEKVIYSLPELIALLLKLINLHTPSLSELKQHSSSYVSYPKGEIVFNGRTMLNLSKKYINSLANIILYPISLLIIILSTFLKFAEIWLLSFITKFFAHKYQITLSSKQAFNLTAIALIPTLTIKALNAISLWSSNLLTTYPISTLLLLAINLYYINFAVKSLKNNS